MFQKDNLNQRFSYYTFDSYLIVYDWTNWWGFLPRLNDENMIFFEIVFDSIKQLDFEQAIVECNKLKERFVDIANYNLAILYYLTGNIEDFLKCIKISMDLGNAKAITNFAVYNHYILKNYDVAEENYLKAIELNHAEAMNCYAIFNEYIRQKYDVAGVYYLKAIKHGDFFAIGNYATFNYLIRKDNEAAEKYYLKSFKRCDDRYAMNNYAFFLDQTKFKQFDELVRTYYLKAIVLGCAQSLACIGDFYLERGYKNKGLMYLEWASEKGLAYAKSKLSLYVSVKNWTERYCGFFITQNE